MRMMKPDEMIMCAKMRCVGWGELQAEMREAYENDVLSSAQKHDTK